MSSSQKVNLNDIERLVRASQAGQRRAFDKLVPLYQQQAMRVAVRILGNANEASDAIQDGFVKAYLNIGKLKEPSRFDVWLLRIITNTAISRRRAAKRGADKIRITEYCEDNQTVQPMQKQIAEELNKAIQQSMLKLSKKEAKAISLFGLNDLSHNEVAEIMDCSVEAVRWHVFNARKKLKRLLKDYL